MSNVDTVKQVYEAFCKGDISAIIDKLDENVAWDMDVRRAGRSVAVAAPWQRERPRLLREPGAPSFHPLRAAQLLRGRRQSVCAGSHRSGYKRESVRHPERRPFMEVRR